MGKMSAKAKAGTAMHGKAGRNESKNSAAAVRAARHPEKVGSNQPVMPVKGKGAKEMNAGNIRRASR